MKMVQTLHKFRRPWPWRALGAVVIASLPPARAQNRVPPLEPGK